MARKDYAGAAVSTTITTSLTATTLSIPIAASTGWPAGTNGKFFVVINRGGANEEKVLVLSRVGNTLTVSGTGDRGADGTSAQTHNSGETIEHGLAAQDIDEPNAHINDTLLDHHTQYLNTTRHDVTARHTAGTVVPTGVPGTIAPDDTASEGTAATVARADHRHAITAAAPGSITPDAAAAEGTASTFARSDHAHAITTSTANTIVPDAVAAEGVAADFARSDHTHGIATDVAVTVSSANAEGVSTSFSRADHTHAVLDDTVWVNHNPGGNQDVTGAGFAQWGGTTDITVPSWATKAIVSVGVMGTFPITAGSTAFAGRVAIGSDVGTQVQWAGDNHPFDSGRESLAWHDQITLTGTGTKALQVQAFRVSGSGAWRADTSSDFTFLVRFKP